MTKPQNIWRVVISTTEKTVNAFEEALSPHCEAVFWHPTESKGEWQVEGFSINKPNRDELTKALGVVAFAFVMPIPDILIVPVYSSDWLSDSLKLFPPIDAGRFFIYGSHYHGTLPFGRIPILLDPGRAFGAGSHATTLGCLLALSDMLGKKKFYKPIDMGCGSGILSVALAKAWRVPVTGFDVDLNAVRVAKANIRRNSVLPRVGASYSNAYGSSIVKDNAPYDLVVSNILANPLCQMAKNMSLVLRNISMGGCLAVLSGFLDSDANRVYAVHHAYGFRKVRSYHIKGWCTLVLKR